MREWSYYLPFFQKKKPPSHDGGFFQNINESISFEVKVVPDLQAFL